MRERIEQKLGCSIDEWIERWKKKMEMDAANDWETEERSDTLGLTDEEGQFIIDYYYSKTA